MLSHVLCNNMKLTELTSKDVAIDDEDELEVS